MIRSQGTDRPKLTKILASEIATETLMSTRDFDRAAEEAGVSSDRWLTNVISLETIAKRVADGISDLPKDMPRDEIDRAALRLNRSGKHVAVAESVLKTFFP